MDQDTNHNDTTQDDAAITRDVEELRAELQRFKDDLNRFRADVSRVEEQLDQESSSFDATEKEMEQDGLYAVDDVDAAFLDVVSDIDKG
jgi:uncharacterized protein YlxW (UPF0749 family)